MTTTPSLPPLEWLKVFEAAGRLANFTAAAEELHLTQAAVSQRIRKLEAWLGVALFQRQARGVQLTAEGDAYLVHVNAALGELARCTGDLFGRYRVRKITLAAPASVATLWLAPRLSVLRREQPGLALDIAAIYREADYAAVGADLEARFGAGRWPDRDGIRLFDEALAPVASPALIDGMDPADWRGLPVLAVRGPRVGWAEWVSRSGEAAVPAAAYRFDSFVTALAAAEAGAGVLLASLPLAQSALAAGALVRLPGPVLTPGLGYWLLRARGQAADGHLDTVMRAMAGPSVRRLPSPDKRVVGATQ